MKERLAWLKHLYSPTAVGLYVTASFVWVASTYFANLGHEDDKTTLQQFLSMAHQKSVDFRLKQRGERSGTIQVGLLTVDEKAVATVGRWPWPRDVTAKAIENAVKHGAKVLAFDVVFSEASNNQLAEAIQKLESKVDFPPETKQKIEEEIKNRDGDAALAKVFSAYNKNLVLGSFGPQNEQVPEQETFDYCFDLIFSLQPASDLWLNKEQSGIIVQNGPPELPQTLKDFYRNHLQQIAETLTEGNRPQNSSEEYALQSEILQKQVNYCTNFLDKTHDETYEALNENWAAVLGAEDDSFREKYPTFDAWIAFIRSVSARNAVPLVSQWTMNIPRLTEGEESFNTGYFIAKQDPDGTIRRSNIILRSGHTYMPSIALKAFLLANNYNAQVNFKYNAATRQQEIDKLQVLNEDGEPVFNIPVDPGGRLAINYAGKQMMFPYVSMAEMLTEGDELTYSLREPKPGGGWVVNEHKAKKSDFMKDKIFVVGATAIGIYDLRVTPFEENFPGAETHVTVIDNLIRKDFLVSAP
ncbi:MAG: CHASE2 domain-containing protein, partial [Bdellovibrionales bacterium]